MNKILMTTIVAVMVIAVIGLGLISANGLMPFSFKGNSFGKGNMTKEDIQKMKDFKTSVETAIKNKDYATWKSLMESQLTEDNFNKLVDQYSNMQQHMQNMQNKTQNNLGNKGMMGRGMMGRGSGKGMHKRFDNSTQGTDLD